LQVVRLYYILADKQVTGCKCKLGVVAVLQSYRIIKPQWLQWPQWPQWLQWCDMSCEL
jgi:hypothetical protein